MSTADTLAGVGLRLGRLAEQIAADWPDDHGREWAERSARLGRDLLRAAHAAADLDRGTADGDQIGGRADQGLGMRLGSTDASRADNGLGVRIAELPDRPPG